MKLDVDFNAEDESVTLTIPITEFSQKRDLAVGLSILQTFAADYDMDPEIEPADLQEYLDKAKEDKKDYLVFDVSEDGIELELVAVDQTTD